MKLNYFNFKQFKDKVLLTNDFGLYEFVTKAEFKKIISRDIDVESELGQRLLASKIIYEESDLEYSNKYRYDLRESKRFVNTSTSLHIFVVTTSCNMNCIYCQANNGIKGSHLVMTEDIAEKAVDIALQSPTKYLSFEFQGGEPLLNFPIIKHIVEYSEKQKGDHCINYNIVSNLTLLADEMIDFFVEYKIGISTSLDGSQLIHDKNRMFTDGTGTYKKVCESIQKIKAAGLTIGAIETTTRYSISKPEEIVKAYLELGFDNIFIRPLTPLGKAKLHWDEIGYTSEEYLTFYKTVLEQIIEENKSGRFIKENLATILLDRMSGICVNYMELRSPCGAGIGQVAYYADGNIFTCDEGRMLYEMGQDTFCLGNVFDNTYNDIIGNSVCKTVCSASVLESIPACCDCVYQPYCGTCPVVNYAQDNDVIEKMPKGYRCRIYSGILDYLFGIYYSNREEDIKVLDAWRG